MLHNNIYIYRERDVYIDIYILYYILYILSTWYCIDIYFIDSWNTIYNATVEQLIP